MTGSDGERRSVIRMPYRFSDAIAGPARGVPETGEHTADVLREWTGRADLAGRSPSSQVVPQIRLVDTVPLRP